MGFKCPRGYGECENAGQCCYPGRCGARAADAVAIRVICSGCGEKCECDERTANSPEPVLCDDCQDAAAGKWEPDRQYRAGYDYACGYHD